MKVMAFEVNAIAGDETNKKMVSRTGTNEKIIVNGTTEIDELIGLLQGIKTNQGSLIISKQNDLTQLQSDLSKATTAAGRAAIQAEIDRQEADLARLQGLETM